MQESGIYNGVHNGIWEIELVPVTFWPPALARRLAGLIQRSATVAITAGTLFGVAMGFAGLSHQNDTLLQRVAYSVAEFTGLIG